MNKTVIAVAAWTVCTAGYFVWFSKKMDKVMEDYAKSCKPLNADASNDNTEGIDAVTKRS